MTTLVILLTLIILVGVLFKLNFNHFGQAQYANQNFDNLKICGETLLENVGANYVKVLGTLKFNNVHLDTLKILGPVKGKGGSAKSIIATGEVLLEDFECLDLDIIGAAKLSNIKLKNIGSLVGEVVVKNSSFDEDLSVWANEPKFKNCTFTQDLIVKNTKFAAKIHLSDGCVVNGNVVLENPDATIIQDPSSKILGEVIYRQGQEQSLLSVVWQSIVKRIF